MSFLEYRYPLLAPLLREEGLDLALASTDDIAAMKLAAVAHRGSRKKHSSATSRASRRS